ncbi:MAG TPA: Ig-like domain-containing protein [candidate division Zixibacteria bacterium]|nr:Ig-like domain-containing protein [candidate division Zixibacteria bacterium]
MSYSRYLTRLVFLFGAIIIFSACRKDEEPSPTPTVEVVRPEPTLDVPTPTPEVEIVPEPEEDEQPAIEADWPPQVVYSSPVPGEEVLLDGAITIRFDQPMDETSVEESLSITIQEEGKEVAGSVSWPRPDTVIFTPKETLERSQEYKVEISEKALGRNGKPLREPVALKLQTVGYLDVSQVIPAGGTPRVQTDAALTVVFNRPVVPLVSSSQKANLIQPLLIEPEAVGEGEWVSTSIYRFVPSEPLAGGTRYHVSIESGLEDVTGGILARDVSWNFSTQGPEVVSTDPANEDVDVDPSLPITITFNMPMDRPSTEAAITLQPNTPAGFQWAEGDRVVSLVPSQMLDLETDYLLTVADSARSANGQATPSRDRIYSFSTVNYPRVLNTMPVNGELASSYLRGISIVFSSPMDLNTLEDQVVITPTPEEVVYYFNDYDFSLSINFDFERNADYSVTVPAAAADRYGNTLGTDYSWSFQTPGYPPMISLNLPLGWSQLSTSYPSDVELIHRNLSSYRAELRQARLPGNLLRSPREDDPVYESSPIRSWSENLEASQDETGVHTLSLADGGVLPTGVYYLTLRSPEVTSENSWWQNHDNVLIVADTNITVKEMFGRVYVWATEMATGQPAPGRNLIMYDREGRVLGSAITDSQGLADIPYSPFDRYLSGVTVISNNPGEAGFGVGSSNWDEGINPWQFGLNSTTSSEVDRFAYLYTDRPIYRPGDTVHFRGIVRDTDFGRYPLPSDQQVAIELYSLIEYETVDFGFNATLDENGEFNGEYVIPADAQLGNYSLNINSEDTQGYLQFTVAEYRKPEFQVSATPDQDEVVRGDPAEVKVEASYYFGGAATDLPVKWTVYEDDYQFPWDGPNYYFGDSAGFYFDFGSGDGFSDETYVGNFVTSGEGQTDGDGRFIIQLPENLLEDVSPGSRRVTVEASIRDVNEFPVTTRTEIVYHASDVYVGVSTDRWFTTAGTGTDANVITVDWDGDPIPGQDVELTLYRREWRPIRESDTGRYYTRWEVTHTEEEQVRVTTDDQGKATARLVPSTGGSYLIVARTVDDRGRSNNSSTFLWVSSSGHVGWRVDPKERRMDLTADKDEYLPGNTAQILVQSPFTGPLNAWLTIERGDLIEQQLITLQSNSDVIEIPIRDAFAPNVFVAVHAVKGIDETNQFADMRIGMTELIVSPEHLGLNISLIPGSDLHQPGDTVEYDIVVTDHQGNPVQTNLSLALVDLAVLSLKADNAPHILDSFYERQPLRSKTGSGLIISGEGLEIEIPIEEGGRGGGGGGFDESATGVFSLEEEDEVRKDFPDTAYWRAKVATDANGRATISIPLPDSLTTWRLSSKGVSEHSTSGETLVGQNQVDIIATLPLLVRPITPRFLTVGDKLQLGAVVHNNTSEPLEVTVSLDATGLTLSGPTDQTFDIPVGGREVVRWPVTVDDVRFADLTFRADGGGYHDASKPTFGIAPDQLLPVVRFSGEDVVGTSGVLDEAGRRVEAILLPPRVDRNQGEVKINLSPSLAAAVLEALDYVNRLEDRPACAHSVTDQLLSNIATYFALQQTGYQDEDLTNKLQSLVQEDIGRLEDLQKANGGWGWCYSIESDRFLSAYALLALEKADEAGFDVPRNVLIEATTYLRNQLKSASDLVEVYEINRQAFFLYVLSELNQVSVNEVDDLFVERRELLDPYAKGLLLMAKGNLGQGNVDNATLIADLNNSVLLSASGAHWEDAIPDWDNLGSDIRGTAMIIEALARVDPENPLLPNAVRWLMVARTADHWPTGQDNAWSILALSDWMAASDELNVDYDYNVAVNGRGLSQGHFGGDNITENEELAIAIDELLPEEVNFIDFQRGEGDGRLYYTTYLDSFIDANDLEAVNRGIVVERAYYDAGCDPEETVCEPITSIDNGQQVRVELTIVVPSNLLYVILRDPIPAGTEAIDPGLLTTGSSPGGSITRTDRDYRYGYWGWWYFDRIEYRDDAVLFLSNYLPAGTYQFTYHLQATIPGEYQVIPATARQEFFPEVFGRSEGKVFTIVE